MFASEALINLSALRHNLLQVRKLASASKVMAMIKSNGYGHGILPVARALQEKADAFGVALLSEAIELRDNGIENRILIMRGFGNVDELSMVVEHGFDVVVHDVTQLEILEQITLAKPIVVWLKVDTGMNRLGFAVDELDVVYNRLRFNRNVQQPVYLISHFASADDLSNSLTFKQLNNFQCITLNLPKSMANSAAIINLPLAHGDWVRPGIILYGVSPVVNSIGLDYGLKPVMTLCSKLIAVKTIFKGGQVGYGATWVAPEDMLIGIVGIGYGDGYPRHAKSGTPVLINGIVCPLIGRVSMDMIAVDLRNNIFAKCGDLVTLWGDGLPVEDVARWADTIAYDLLCGVAKRVDFKYCA